MKKQKFNGKLKLKKNVISGFSLNQVRGGGDTVTDDVYCTNTCTLETDICTWDMTEIHCTLDYCGSNPETTDEGCRTQLWSCNCL